MFVAVLSSDQEQAKRLGDRILEACLNKGCYSTFLCFRADESFVEELERREFNTVVITANGPHELLLAKLISERQPEAKLVLLGTDKTAVEGYTLNVHYCADTEPGEADLECITTVIFPPVQE